MSQAKKLVSPTRPTPIEAGVVHVSQWHAHIQRQMNITQQTLYSNSGQDRR